MANSTELALQILFGLLGLVIALTGLHYRGSLLCSCIRRRRQADAEDVEGMIPRSHLVSLQLTLRKLNHVLSGLTLALGSPQRPYP
jgi:hypothetical protein